MSVRPEFDIDGLPQAAKGVYRMSVEGAADGNIVETVKLVAGDLASGDVIQRQIEGHCDQGTLSTPVLAARGARPGKTLVATAGIHGDEYEGMEAIHRVFAALDPAAMQGTFVAVPAVTLPAFWTATRVNPVDGRNMARVFPGSAKGSPSERLAARLLDRVLRHADLYIDLHSSGRVAHWVTLCGFCEVGKQADTARAAAKCFGAPVIWEHPYDPEARGRTLSATNDLGIPSLYTEAHGGGHARPEDVDCYTRGLANLLEFLEIAALPLAGLPQPYEPVEVSGAGNVDKALNATQSGLIWPQVRPGDRVPAGQLLAFIRDLEGRVVEEIVSPEAAFVIGIRAQTRIFAGENVAILT